MARNWTPEERQKQSEIARNAHKQGMRSRDLAEFRRLLRIQNDFVKLLLARENAKTNPHYDPSET